MSKWIVAVDWDEFESSVYEFATYEEAKEKFNSYNSDTVIDKIYMAQVVETKGRVIVTEKENKVAIQQLREELDEVKQKHKLLDVLYQQQQDMYEKELSRLRQENECKRGERE